VWAAAAAGAGDWPSAADYAEKHLQRVSEHAETLSLYWWALDELGRADEALTAAEKLHRIQPSRPELV
jgi:hypothetical protein